MAGETTKTTNADRCKRYREKNKEEYKINDALRKKRARLILKTQDKEKHEQLKKKDRERKQLAKITSKIQVTATPDQAASTSSPHTPFSNSAIKSRTIKRVEKSLPQSPRRKSEVIKSLVSKFNVKIQFGQKTGRKKKVLSENEQQWVKDFLDRPDISYTTPGRRDVLLVFLTKLKNMHKNDIFYGK